MWFRNGSDEVLLIQFARIKSEKKSYKLSLLFLCEVRVSLKAEDTPPKRWTTFSKRSGTQSTYCIRWKLWGCLIGGGGGWLRRKRRTKVLPKIFLGRKPRLITYFLRDYLTKVPQPQHFQSWDCYQSHKRKFLMSFIRFFLHGMVSWVWLIIAPLCFLAESPAWSLFNKSSEVEALTVLAAVLRCACKWRTIFWIRNFK